MKEQAGLTGIETKYLCNTDSNSLLVSIKPGEVCYFGCQIRCGSSSACYVLARQSTFFFRFWWNRNWISKRKQMNIYGKQWQYMYLGWLRIRKSNHSGQIKQIFKGENTVRI